MVYPPVSMTMGISNAIVPQSRWECIPWAAEATSILTREKSRSDGITPLLRNQALTKNHRQWLAR
jgi:hypothetical protein